MAQEPNNLLLQRLEELMKKQALLQEEMARLRQDIHNTQESTPVSPPAPSAPAPQPKKDQLAELYDIIQAPQPAPEVKPPSTPRVKLNWEKIIGENLINKVGILIMVLGVGIGAKYAIDNDLISPALRILLGYVVGAALLFLAIRLKQKFTNFSAVLLSGSMAIFYFITFLAYDLYDLIPQVGAFAVMVAFTGFTVVAALHYSRPIIAHLGLVGAYAVPFLLSNDTGNAAILFSYTALINAGILIISYQKYWKSLTYVAFGFTWLIFLSWYFSRYTHAETLALGLNFSVVFFTLFYTILLAYKLRKKEVFQAGDVVLILLNSFIFYALGFDMLNEHAFGKEFLGLFTLANAVVHFGVGLMIYRQQLADRNLFYLVLGLVLVFITMAIPVQLDGNWVTLLWAGEAVVLFTIGRKQKVGFYEMGSITLMGLALLSLFHDWQIYGSYYEKGGDFSFPAVFNVHFLTSILAAGAFGGLVWIQSRHTPSEQIVKWGLEVLLKGFLPIAMLLVLYLGIRLEIFQYFHQLYINSMVVIEEGEYAPRYFLYDYKRLSAIWILLYSLVFVAGIRWVLKRRKVAESAHPLLLLLQGVVLIVFMLQGLLELSELREAYLSGTNADIFHRWAYYLPIRYLSLTLALGTLWMIWKDASLLDKWVGARAKTMAILFVHLIIWWILSSELIHWLDIGGYSSNYKLGLSILWGIYSLGMVALGIAQKNKPVRIAAIGLFGFTLLKLFFYDIAHLNTIAKTIVFVLLGALLLIISFLYNKYKIEDEKEPVN
jgi:uncharacterized membrane protein